MTNAPDIVKPLPLHKVNVPDDIPKKIIPNFERPPNFEKTTDDDDAPKIPKHLPLYYCNSLIRKYRDASDLVYGPRAKSVGSKSDGSGSDEDIAGIGRRRRKLDRKEILLRDLLVRLQLVVRQNPCSCCCNQWRICQSCDEEIRTVLFIFQLRLSRQEEQ